ncbi:hypothetical protein GF327_10150 [Candidatus Woesearchaeota archaeon]|nr:hypothetical protein [Candidatus Woesearchaeota archaeon]
MIKNSFIFLEKIGNKKEENIIKQGICDWNDFLKKEKIRGISKKSKSFYNRKIIEAGRVLFNNDSSYFLGKLPNKEMYRLYPFFREEAAFIKKRYPYLLP